MFASDVDECCFTYVRSKASTSSAGAAVPAAVPSRIDGAAAAACASSSAIVPSRIDGVQLRDLSRANQGLRETCLHASKRGETAPFAVPPACLPIASVLQAASSHATASATIPPRGRTRTFGDRIFRG